MKILVTGGAGFIGSNFIRYWLKKYSNDSIVNLDLLTYAGNLENLKDLEGEKRYEFAQGNICDFNLVDSWVKKTDLVVNFAAETHVDRSVLDSADFIKTNIEGVRILLEACKNNGNKRLHHISTDEVFGSLRMEDRPFNEKSPYDPRSPYSASKAASDHLVRAYFHTHGLPVTISNCSNNYGPFQFPEKFIPLVITNLLEGKKIPIYETGENIRDWIFVDDHNRGVDLIIQKGKIGETYCLGGGKEMTNLDLVKRILELMGMGEERIEFVKDRPGHDLRYGIDFSKAEKELGWHRQVDLEKGLAETVAWYQENVSWWKKSKAENIPNITKSNILREKFDCLKKSVKMDL